MANKEITLINITNQEQLPMRAVDNGDGTYSYSVSLKDLVDGALRITDATTWEPFSISASGQAFLGPAILSDLVFVGASGAVLSIYDNSSASGSALCSITLPAAISVPIPLGSIEIAVGLYVTITGTGTLMGKRKAVV